MDCCAIYLDIDVLDMKIYLVVIWNFLNNSEYAKLNANTAVEQLKQMGEEAKLSGQQAEAWNNLIERLKKTNGTMADIAIVLGMICNRFISSVGIKINTGK